MTSCFGFLYIGYGFFPFCKGFNITELLELRDVSLAR